MKYKEKIIWKHCKFFTVLAILFLVFNSIACNSGFNTEDPDDDGNSSTPPVTGTTSDGFVYSETTTITITGYIGAGGTLGIPPVINEKQVTAIANANTVYPNGVFQGKNLTSISLPNSITSIGSEAFRDNQLTYIALPTYLISIGSRAFLNNQLAGSLTIPNRVTTIGVYAFGNTDTLFLGNRLTSVTIGNQVTTIGSYAFYCNMMTSVTIGNQVNTIESYAFNTNMLTSVSIPSSVTTIGSYAFYYNPLESVTIGANVILSSNAFGYGFEAAYNAANKAAGTYTRTSSTGWTKT